MRELLRTDLEAAYEGDPAALYSEEIVLSHPFIGANSTIGANGFLMQNVPPDSLVVDGGR